MLVIFVTGVNLPLSVPTLEILVRPQLQGFRVTLLRCASGVGSFIAHGADVPSNAAPNNTPRLGRRMPPISLVVHVSGVLHIFFSFTSFFKLHTD